MPIRGQRGERAGKAKGAVWGGRNHLCRTKGRACHRLLPPKGQSSDDRSFCDRQAATSGQATPAEATPDTRMEDVLKTSDEESNLNGFPFTVGFNGGIRTRSL